MSELGHCRSYQATGARVLWRGLAQEGKGTPLQFKVECPALCSMKSHQSLRDTDRTDKRPFGEFRTMAMTFLGARWSLVSLLKLGLLPLHETAARLA